MNASARKLLARLRVVVYAVVLACILWGFWRFEVATLPTEGCSPVLALEPGQRMLLDAHPTAFGPGDVVFFRHEGEGRQLIATVDEPPASASEALWRRVEDEDALWVVCDRVGCPSDDSRLLGPIAREHVDYRLVLAWGP